MNENKKWKVQHRWDTAANWRLLNPVLLAGEKGIVSDSPSAKREYRVGDGTTHWNDLPASFDWDGKMPEVPAQKIPTKLSELEADALSQHFTKKEKDKLDGLTPGGGGNGATNYNDLTNKPQINGHELTGNQTSEELGITSGSNGKSAYEIACDKGFVGTEDEWLASLKGEPGTPGANGATLEGQVLVSDVIPDGTEQDEAVPKNKAVKDFTAKMIADLKVELVKGYYYLIGNVGSVAYIVGGQDFSCKKIAVCKGQKLHLKGTSLGNAKLWGTLNGKGEVVRRASDGTKDEVITIESGEDYLIFNTYGDGSIIFPTGSVDFIFEYLSGKIEESSDVLSTNLIFDFSKNVVSGKFFVNNSPGDKPIVYLQPVFSLYELPVYKDSVIHVEGKGSADSRIWATLDKGGRVVRCAGENDMTADVTIQEGEIRIIGSFNNTYDFVLQTKSFYENYIGIVGDIEKLKSIPYATLSDVDARIAQVTAPKNRGLGLQRFYAKAWSMSHSWNDTYKQRTIKIVSVADSIGNSFGEDYIKGIFSEAYPDITFEYLFVNYGGSGPWHMLPKMKEVIMFNPDLVLCGEWETYETKWSEQQTLDTLIMLLKEYTQADVALWAHSFRRESADLLAAKNLDGYLDSLTHRVRTAMMGYAKKYSCEFIDLQYSIITGLLDGSMTVDQIFASPTDVVHPSEFTKGIFLAEFKKHFRPMYGSEYIAFNNGANSQISRMFSESISLPDISEIKTSGAVSWITVNNGSQSGNILKAENGATVEFKIRNSTGCEITSYGGAVGTYKTLIDGKDARTVVKDYATSALSSLVNTDSASDIFSRIHKIYVTNNILRDDEDKKTIDLKITSLDFASGSIAYDIFCGEQKLGSGNVNKDCTFTLGGGSIVVPKNYGFDKNYRSGEYDTNYPKPQDVQAIEVGKVYHFNIHKGIVGTYSLSEDNQTHFNNVVGLLRGDYTIKLQVTSGTVYFDTYMEY